MTRKSTSIVGAREAAYLRRLERLRTLLNSGLKNEALVAIFCMDVVEAAHGGKWRTLGRHAIAVIQDRWGSLKVTYWYFWHKTLLGKSREQLDALIDDEVFGDMTPEQRAEIERMAEEACK